MWLVRPPVSSGDTVKVECPSRFYSCALCLTNCRAAESLAEHLLGGKHKRKLQSTKPQKQNEETRLSYFLKAHLKEDPIVGLEYVLEVKKDSWYKYSCQLCKVVNAGLPHIVAHINNALHMERYINKHFTYLLPRFIDKAKKRLYAQALRDAAATIVKQQGNKKEIQVVLHDSDGKISEASKDAPPSKPESGNISNSKLSPLPYQKKGSGESHARYRYNKLFQKYICNDPPLAKRSRCSPEGDPDALPSTAQISKHGSSHYESPAIRMDCGATQELEFRTNDDFLEYLANFVISDDEDASFIRTITQNCIKTLTSFLEEEAERQKTGHQPEAPLEDTSRTAQNIPGILEDETELHLSDSETTLLKENSNPPSDTIPKNEATDLFFNSIKDMDESEVVGVFQKLAATNSEFQEMDIPTVVRFLKDCGRFKKP